MKFGFLNAFPWVEFSAEREFIRRCIGILEGAGHEAVELLDSDAVIAYDPDVVFSTHQFAPKLTDHFTVGAGWNPLSGILGDRRQYGWMRSWDLTLPINAEVRGFLEDLHRDRGSGEAISHMDFFPSAANTDLAAADLAGGSLVYVGTLWDRNRHGMLFSELAAKVDFNAYGPAGAWSFLPGSYRGTIPFDGKSVSATLNRHGIVLALHKGTHRDGNTPSMRVFEACAAGCFVITDPMPALVERFGDTLDYVDTRGDDAATAAAIVDIVRRVVADPQSARRRAAAAREIFVRSASLDVLLAGFVAEVGAAVEARRRRVREVGLPITVILRVAAGEAEAATATLASLARAGGGALAVRIVGPGAGDLDAVECEAGDFRSITVVAGEGAPSRGALTRAALATVDDPLVAIVDAGDEIFVDHFSSATAAFGAPGAAVDIVQGGCVLVSDGGVLPPFLAPPPLTAPDGRIWSERRRLGGCEAIGLDDLFDPSAMISLSSFVLRTSLFTAETLADPGLERMDDFCLLVDLLSQTDRLRFTGRVAVAHRVASGVEADPLARGSVAARAEYQRIAERFAGRRLGDGRSMREVFTAGRGRLDGAGQRGLRAMAKAAKRLFARLGRSIAKRLRRG